jgi:RNA polymerase sigma factor (sigma-70 family)
MTQIQQKRQRDLLLTIEQKLCLTFGCSPEQLRITIIDQLLKNKLYQYELLDTTVIDILGEVCIQAIKAVEKGTVVEHPTSWCLLVGERKIIGELRKKKKRESIIAPDFDIEEIHSLGLIDEIEWSDTIEDPQLEKALAALSPLEYRIIQLNILEDRKFEEVSRILKSENLGEITVQSLRKKKSRALKKPRDLLSE